MRDKEKYNAYHKEYQLKRYHRRRAEAIEKLGGRCSVCGIVAELEIDHIDPSTKSFDVAKLWSVSNERFINELAKCQILCDKHHKAKTSLEDEQRRPITHGKYWAAYKYKCKCDQCLQYKKDYALERKIKRNMLP